MMASYSLDTFWCRHTARRDEAEERRGTCRSLAPTAPHRAHRAQVSRSRPQDPLRQHAGWHPTGGITMQTSMFRNLLKLGVIASVALLALPARADDEHSRSQALVQLPSGQYITPTAIPGALQQFLNPGLPAYPDFVAGTAVRAQLSPDGTTLAILCAGQNSLYKPDGTVDTANSTQYIFLYNVADANSARPELTQVIKQTNAHVGLVFSPDGNTLYAAGGNDDAVYVYTKSGDSFTAAMPIALGHKTSTVVNAGVGIGVQPNASGLGISADGKTLVVANNYNDSISVIDTKTRTVRYEHDLRPFFANNEGTKGVPGGTFPFAVVVKGNDTAYVSSDRDQIGRAHV